MNKFEYVYYNSYLLGKIDDNKCISFTKEEKQKWVNDLQNLFIKKDVLRKTFSLIIGIVMLFLAVILAILMIFKVVTLGSSQWFNYTFVLAGLVLVWVILYYIFGLLFYRSIKLNVYFKNPKSNQKDSCVYYASSNYFKFIQQYQQYIGKSEFYINKKNKKVLLPFCLRIPKTMTNFIFNGHIKSNVPYFYLLNKNQKFIFLPGLVIIINGKNSKVFTNDEIKIKVIDKTYQLYHQDELLVEFTCYGTFNLNFFYFKYEQC